MISKWSNTQYALALNDENLIDDYIKMSKNDTKNFPQSNLHYLNGYLYESPTHKGVVCWRALDEYHNIHNIKHLLTAVDLESNSKANFLTYSHSSPLKTYNKSFYKPKPTIEYLNSVYMKSDMSKEQKFKSSIYEGCYNAHDLQTSLKIQKILKNIFVNLNENCRENLSKNKIPSKNDLKSSNYEFRLLNEYEALKSSIEKSSQVLNSKHKNSINESKSDLIENNDFVRKLEKESINKIEDELKSNCDEDIDNESIISSTSLEEDSNFSKKKEDLFKKKKRNKKNIKRQRLFTFLDNKTSSSDKEINKNTTNNKNLDKKNQVIYRQYKDSDTKSNFKKNYDKSNKSLIAEFEKISPTDFNKFNSIDKEKFKQAYKDLSNNNNSSSNSIVNKTNDLNNQQKTNDLNNQQIEQDIEKKKTAQITQNDELNKSNSDHQRPIYYAINKNNSQNKKKANSRIQDKFNRIREKIEKRG